MSMRNCPHCLNTAVIEDGYCGHCRQCTMPPVERTAGTGSQQRVDMPRTKVGGDFYGGIEWLACWLLDNVEGETITEEQLRPWAAKAWEAYLNRHINALSDRDNTPKA